MSVEIIGRSAIAPGADTPEELFELLRQRRCSVTQVPTDRWDQARYLHPMIGTRGKTYTFAAGIVDSAFKFDAAVFGISQREAGLMDPQQRMILHLVWQAFESANIDFTDLHDQRVGVYVGASSLDHANLIVEDPAAAGPHFMTGNTLSIVSNRISHAFGLSGPSLTIDTACSSSLVALDLAVKALEAGTIDTAIVGGVNALTHPLPFVGFAQARMLSPEGLCRAYDDDGMGYVRAEGGAALIIRRSDASLANNDRSFARIVASAVNSAGHTNGISMPSETAQQRLLRSLYNASGVDPNRVAFIEGHGTGTRVGDPAEVWSIGTVVGAGRRAPIPIGSIKTNIGHAEPASGLLGLMKAMLSLENNYLPASLHFDTPNKSIDFDGLNVHVASEPIELLHSKQPRFAGINSFGFGGTNAHVIICDPQRPRHSDPSETVGKVFFASAQTASALGSLLKKYQDALIRLPSSEAKHLIAAAGANRHHLRHRFVVASDDVDEILGDIDRKVRSGMTADAVEGDALRDREKIAFVFSGNGSQWAGMGVSAYRTSTAFRDRFNVIHALFQVRSQIDLIELLTDPELEAKLSDTKIAQPLLFAVQASLADVLGSLGIRPNAVFGHSVGEVAAAYVSGAISLVDAVSVVAKRSYHQDRLAGAGKMAVMQLSAGEAEAFLERSGLDEVHVAAINSKGSVTVSGPSAQIDELKLSMKSARIVGQVLDINYPFHHPLIEIARDSFIADMAQIALRPTQIPFISTVTGKVLSGESLDADYWWKNVREPVQFYEATKAALDLECGVFVEIGPRPILLAYVRDTIKEQSAPASAIPSLVRENTVRDPVWHAYSRVLASGGAFDRKRAFGARNTNVSLPSLPIEAVEIRHEFTSDTVDLYGRQHAPFTLAGWRVDPVSGNWKNHIDAHLFPDLAEHVVDNKPILPGSAFIDIAVSVARAFLETDAIEISNMEIIRPLDLPDTQIRELSTSISRDTGDIQISSRERLSDDDWTVHAVARCRKSTGAAPKAIRPAAAISKAKTIEANGAYETARRFGLDYGPAFQLLKSSTRVDTNEIEVSLRAPLPPRNAFVNYSLHPISVDAAFHGLVAIFGSLSGASHGAPYIPVHFGSVRVHAAGEAIERARLSIRRVSANSIKVDIVFIGKADLAIASFEDVRFRRTFLRQRKSLDEVSYHQVLVRSALGNTHTPRADRVVPALDRGFFPTTIDHVTNSGQQMLLASIYRACFDIAKEAAGRTGRISLDALPGGPAVQRFVANCLYLLEEVDLASREGERWMLEASSNLPPVPAILNALYRERPDQVAQIVAVEHAHAKAIYAIRDAAPRDRTRSAIVANQDFPTVLNDATLDSVTTHAGGTSTRLKLVRQALEQASASQKMAHVVELGSISRSITADFARQATRNGGTFTVVDAREAVVAELSFAFEAWPGVSVVRATDLRSVAPVDILMSLTDQAFDLLSMVEKDAPGSLAFSRQMLFCVPAPSAFADFAFGLNDGWFDRTTNVEFPIGKIASADDWRQLLRSHRVKDVKVNSLDISEGEIICVEAISRREAGAQQPVDISNTLIIHERALDSETIDELADAGARLVSIQGDSLLDQDVLQQVLNAYGSGAVIYVPAVAATPDPASQINRTMRMLSWLAGEFSAASLASGQDFRFGVAVEMDEGDPAAHAVWSGVWAFLRVLRNEFESIEVHAFNIGSLKPVGQPSQILRVAEILASKAENREWAFDGETGNVLEYRVAPGAVVERNDSTADFVAATVHQANASQVNTIAWRAIEPNDPRPDEIRIRVAATGLNFRDVMWAMGMLPEEALEDGFAGTTIGMECAGHIDAIGSNIRNFAVGDAVMAVAPAAFSTHVCVKHAGVARLPNGIDPIAGATLPVAFLTAYYALVELARIRPGETVLVHGGAGGVGIAALQIAKARGARVFATAGSREKRQFLMTLGADKVFNSRTLDFVDEIMTETGNAGVDIVLNSLFSEAMERSLSLVKPFGRFLELGKRDFYSDTKIGLRPFRRNVSYFGIDADQLLNTLPELSGRLLSEISEMFEGGELVPLPYRTFRHDEITSAFRLMQSSGHIGKIVVTAPVPGRDIVQREPKETVTHDPLGVHLVVGGIGGFGLAAASWLVDGGARQIALCSRRGIADAATEAAIANWKRRGVTATVHACDIVDEAAVARMLEGLRARGRLKSVVHAAMVLDDALIPNLTEERIRSVLDPKVAGADILDRLTRADQLDQFLLFSSATTLVGNPGQANYVAANGYLEGLARARRSLGLPALAVAFGAISDTGFLARNESVSDILAKRIGKTAMTATDALSYVDQYMTRDPGTVEAAVVSIAELDMTIATNLKTVGGPLFEVVVRSTKVQSGSGAGGTIDLLAMIAGKSTAEAEKIIFDVVASEVATILRVPLSEITAGKVIKDVGLDSLMAMELGMNFRQKTGFEMPLSSITQSTTVGDVAQKLFQKLSQQTGNAGEEAIVPPATDANIIDHLAARHAPTKEARG